jgi:putative cell wall-binding protein
MSTKLVNALSRKMGTGVSRRGLFRRAAIIGSALTVAPMSYILKPGSAYAAICTCRGQNCDCSDLCCKGYTEFCCTMYGANACPPNTVTAGWWKADGSGFCDVNGVSKPRYYIDCHGDSCSCSCGASGTCLPSCSFCNCECGNKDCRNRQTCCIRFRYGQCNQQMPCIGPIVCRVVTCTPPWEIDSTCTKRVLTDNATRYHDAPCLHSDDSGIIDPWIIGGTAVVNSNVQSQLAYCEATGPVERLAGDNRYETAAGVSVEFNTDPSKITRVFVVTGTNFPDALSVGPIAASDGSPILLTKATSLPDPTRDELVRLSPNEIVVVGGTQAISGGVFNALSALAPATRRIAGTTRYDTAAALSSEFFDPRAVSRVYVATGANFPDSLAVGPVAAGTGSPVLLVTADAIPRAIEAELLRLSPDEIIVVGGPDAISDAIVTQLGALTGTVLRVAGANRYATAAAISKAAYAAGTSRTAFIVTGKGFADALAIVPVAASLAAPVLLVTEDTIPSSTASEISRLGEAPCPAYS